MVVKLRWKIQEIIDKSIINLIKFTNNWLAIKQHK